LAALKKAREKKKPPKPQPHLARFHTAEHLAKMRAVKLAKKAAEQSAASENPKPIETPVPTPIREHPVNLPRSSEGYIAPAPEPPAAAPAPQVAETEGDRRAPLALRDRQEILSGKYVPRDPDDRTFPRIRSRLRTEDFL
jgi:hypothetical protein